MDFNFSVCVSVCVDSGISHRILQTETESNEIIAPDECI